MDINTSELDCLVQKYEELLTSTADTLGLCRNCLSGN